MSTKESEFLLDVWAKMSSMFKQSQRDSAALEIVHSFCEYGFEYADLRDAAEEDKTLAKAIRLVYEEDEEDEDCELEE